MLFPFNTDAPIYHFPYATIGLIVVNVVMYFGTATIAANDTGSIDVMAALREWAEDYEAVEGRKPSMAEVRETKATLDAMNEEKHGSIWTLGFSPKIAWLTLSYDTINPLQWFTHNFMHADIMHLLGNMVFLWGFGIVVEGKLGVPKFLGLYFVACLLQGALVQLPMFLLSDRPGVALGASGAIYALMAVCVLWAPKNELSCFLLMGRFSRVIEIPIIGFAGFYLAIQVLQFCLAGFDISSAALHLVGALIGLPLGLLFLKRKWVDCEGWDFFTVYLADDAKQEKIRTRSRDREKLEAARDAKAEHDEQRERIVGSIQAAIDGDQGKAAVALYHKFESELQRGKKIPTKTLTGLIGAVTKEKKWDASVPLLVELLQRHPPEKSTGARLKLAQILITATEQPRQGIAVLKKLPKQLPDKHAALRSKLVKAAKRSLAEGSLEIEVHDW